MVQKPEKRIVFLSIPYLERLKHVGIAQETLSINDRSVTGGEMCAERVLRVETFFSRFAFFVSDEFFPLASQLIHFIRKIRWQHHFLL